MLFCKLCGAILLLLAGTFGAGMLNRRLDKEVQRMEGWISLVRLVKNQIDCYALPLGEILARTEASLLWRVGWEKRAAPRDFSELCGALPSADMSEEGERAARFFCTEIGKGYREEQLHTCEYTVGLLCAERDRLLSQLPRCRRRNTTLCLSAALGTVIVLF